MKTDRTYTVDQARALLPEVRATLLQVAVERRRANADPATVSALLDHLDSLDIVVRDLEAGLVDFPTVRDGEPAWLCWRLEDGDLGWWHSTSEGFASRHPL